MRASFHLHVIHDERLIVRSLLLLRSVFLRVSLSRLLVLFPLLPALLPCGQRRGKHPLRLRPMRSIASWRYTILSQTVQQHTYSVHIRTPRTICFQWHLTIAFRFVCCCHFLVTVEVELDLNGSRLTRGVRKSTSLTCHTRSGLSFTSQIPTAVYTRNIFLNDVLASRHCVYVTKPLLKRNDPRLAMLPTHTQSCFEIRVTKSPR